MRPKAFIKLLAIFAILLSSEAAATALLLFLFADALSAQVLAAILVGVAVALPLAAFFAQRIARRLRRVVIFASRIAEGDLTARLEMNSGDELSEIEAALNLTAERVGSDFQELESRRHELATMLDTLQEAVVSVTAEGVVRWSNAIMQRVGGMQIRAGRPLVHSMRDPELLGCVRGALERREVCVGRATSLAPGRVFEVNAAPLPAGGALVVLHDVTSIEAAQKSRREFVANVSHELRTPLTSIQGYVETLLDDPNASPETTQEFLGIILKNAARMNRLTVDLLALAGVESPDYQLHAQPVHANILVEDAIAVLGGIVVDSGVTLEFTGAPSVNVMADPDSISQIFGNLVENSLKYAGEGKRICVGAHALESEVEFIVQDFGPGIASEHLDRIFERFYRVDKARSRESGGTGLGLAIVKHIAQVHGGRVWVESELGRGATFHFTLPMAEPPENSGPQDNPPAPPTA
ncbi:MAG: ATP-binding protein [Terracidiphilus sp.]|nr:ATP-binding protein [Terracidiphilus sp.]